MIRYSLKCADGHSFESWFQSAAAYDKLAASGLVCCSVCGSDKVEKAIMAPRVRPGRKAVSPIGEAEPPEPAQSPAVSEVAPETQGALSAPASEMERAIQELRKQVEANSDYVGKDFVSEARAMHLGEAPARAIHGEARPEEAKSLIEDGVPVLPLPFGPSRKRN